MKKRTNNPTMFDTHVTLDGVTIDVDPINRPRSEQDDNVMAIFWEEQPFTWQFIQPYVHQALAESDGSIDFLDIGTGSGIFGILMAKRYSAKVFAIDKSSRAIAQAKANAARNGVQMTLLHQEYSRQSVPPYSTKIVGMNPPFHLYPPEIEQTIPQHARGGSDGQGEFRSQLAIADNHLAKNGVLFFILMCPGDTHGPTFLDYIPKLISDNPSIMYTNVFPPMETKTFLQDVYGNRHEQYTKATAQTFPMLYYTVGIIRRNGKGEVQEVEHGIDLRGRTWQDRVELHQQIAGHESL